MLERHKFEIVTLITDNGSNASDGIFFQDPDRNLFIQCHHIGFVFSNYVYPAIGVIGSLLNILCIWVFSNKKFSTNNSRCFIFKYLLVKSTYDCLILLLNALKPVFNCYECSFNSLYIVKMFEFFFYKYFLYVCTLCSIVFELVAQLDRLVAISVSQPKNWMLPYRIVTIALIAIISTFYSFKLFEYNIEATEYEDEKLYNLYKSSFSITNTFRLFNLIQSFIRDFFCVILLLLLDIFILIVFRRLMWNKKQIMLGGQTANINHNQASTSNNIPNSIANKVDSAENKTTIMILIIGIMTFIGRFPIFLNYLPLNFHWKQCIQFTSESLFLVNISINFFVYIFFNRNFKLVFMRLYRCNWYYEKVTVVNNDMTETERFEKKNKNKRQMFPTRVMNGRALEFALSDIKNDVKVV